MRPIVSAVLFFFALLGIVYFSINQIGFFEWNTVSSIPAEIVFCLIGILAGFILTPIAKKALGRGYKAYIFSFCTITILWLLFTWYLTYSLQYTGVPQFLDSAFVVPAGISHLTLLVIWHIKKKADK